MTHELKRIVAAYRKARAKGLKTVLATVVALDGSSYRRPGVRMLIREDGKMTGAVSGGCVEKEVFRQSLDVFKEGIPRMMTYDGRYRLGCEGILYILMEPFHPESDFLESFEKALKARTDFQVVSYFQKSDGADNNYGSVFQFDGHDFKLRPGFEVKSGQETFHQNMAPCFKLMLVGAEHDAVQLCQFAALTGWEVTVVAHPSEEKSIANFPGATELVQSVPEELDISQVDGQTAIILMTHSYAKDLQALLRLLNTTPAYLGLLGPKDRREKLLGELLERAPTLSDAFMDRIHGPAGLNIGAETAQEIAISILSEILTVIRDQQPMALRNKSGRIHS